MEIIKAKSNSPWMSIPGKSDPLRKRIARKHTPDRVAAIAWANADMKSPVVNPFKTWTAPNKTIVNKRAGQRLNRDNAPCKSIPRNISSSETPMSMVLIKIKMIVRAGGNPAMTAAARNPRTKIAGSHKSSQLRGRSAGLRPTSRRHPKKATTARRNAGATASEMLICLLVASLRLMCSCPPREMESADRIATQTTKTPSEMISFMASRSAS